MTDWSTKLQDSKGVRDMQKARDLDREDIRAWLKAHHSNNDPAVSFDPNVSPVSLFENVWELNPIAEFRGRFTEAVLSEYQTSRPLAKDNADYLGFLIRLMIYLPLTDFPQESLQKLYRSTLSEKLSTDDGVPLRKLAIQAIFARGKVSLADKIGFLKNRDTANLAYKALRDTGIGQAIQHLPALMDTLDAPSDEVSLISHLRILIDKHGETELFSRIENSGIFQTSIHGGRIARLLSKLGIPFETLRVGRVRKNPRPISEEELYDLTAKFFNKKSDPIYQSIMKTAPSNGVNYATNPWHS